MEDQKSESGWQQYVLQSLVERAVPEPIKVACISPPPNKPNWLGEEYHGSIPKSEVNRLLSGKYRYLVRDSTSSPGDYSLSVNFDGEIMHYKLLYDGKYYKTDLSDSEHYETLTELMVHVLNLCKSMKKIGEQSKKKYQKPHEFCNHNFMHPKWCDVCGGFLWGLWSQGMKCEDCGSTVHKACKDKLLQVCEKIVLGHKIAKTSVSVSKSDSASISRRTSELQVSVKAPVKHKTSSGSKFNGLPKCDYFRQCMKFLVDQVPPHYFDFESPLNQCYCEKCLHRDSSSKTENWCRFPLKLGLAQGELGSYKKAYYAVFPGMIKDTLDALESGEFYHKLGEGELVVVPSVQSVGDAEQGYVHTVLEVYVQPNSYKVSSATNSQNGANSSATQVEYWVISKGHKITPNAILIQSGNNN